jgi:hypothetical protein
MIAQNGLCQMAEHLVAVGRLAGAASCTIGRPAWPKTSLGLSRSNSPGPPQ